ncbi:MAG: hypothetical protein NTV68_12280 [Methanomicrobiales archaeon]|nr:hypothetical protein [Methanomicrobiales archaeon]
MPDFVGILAVLGYSAMMLVGFYAFYQPLASIFGWRTKPMHRVN